MRAAESGKQRVQPRCLACGLAKVRTFGASAGRRLCNDCIQAIAESIVTLPASALALVWNIPGGADRLSPDGHRDLETGLEDRAAAETAVTHLELARAYLQMCLPAEALVEAAVIFLMPWIERPWDEAVSLLLGPELLREDSGLELKRLVERFEAR